MDPTDTLRAIRLILRRAEERHGLDAEDAGSLQEHIQALDEWLSKGGFLPHQWTKIVRTR